MPTIIAYHPSGYEVRFEVEPGELAAMIHKLERHRFRASRELAYTAEGMPFCPRHGVPMVRRSKQGDKWFSHKVTHPDTGQILYCRGYAAPSSPGFEISPIGAPTVAREETRSAAPISSGNGRQDNRRPGGSVDLEKLNQELFG
jgi:hypothetical protein